MDAATRSCTDLVDELIDGQGILEIDAFTAQSNHLNTWFWTKAPNHGIRSAAKLIKYQRTRLLMPTGRQSSNTGECFIIFGNGRFVFWRPEEV